MIIKLTELRKVNGTEGHTFSVWVNFSNVTAFNKSINGKDTHIKMVGGAFFFVKESPEDIMKILYPPLMAQTLDFKERFVDDLASSHSDMPAAHGNRLSL